MSTQTVSSPVRPLSAAGAKTSVTVDPDAPTIVIRRRFAAPAALVFEATTRPEHVTRWWGCGAMKMTVCEIDLRVGGSYRYVVEDTDGQIYGWHGTYQAVDAPTRLAFSEVFEGFPDAESFNTATYVERDGHTTLTTTVVHRTMAHRDGHIASGMERGVIETYDRLAALLKSML